jgi:membrane-bound serine protease (ClpP class)
MFFVYLVVILIIVSLIGLLLYRWLVAKEIIIETASALKTSEQQEVGNVGISMTVLRPSGKAKFNGKTYIVDADNQFIEKDMNIKIINIQGNKIVVDKI